MRHRVRARLPLTSICTVCALALPASALAAGSPVHVDPASPVAKEYALPLATARGAPPESGQTGRLFGSGIKHASSSTATRPRAATSPPPPPPVEPQATPTPTTPAPAVTATAPVPTITTTAVTPRSRRPRRPAHVTTVTLPVLTAPAATRRLRARATPAAYRVLRPGSSSGLLWMLVAAVLVLALGSAGGIALSRRR